MSLIKFLLYRKKDKSPLASRKYGEKKVNPEELDKSLLASKKYSTFTETDERKRLEQNNNL